MIQFPFLQGFADHLQILMREGLLQVIISGGVHDMNDISFTPEAADKMESIQPNLSKSLKILVLNLTGA